LFDLDPQPVWQPQPSAITAAFTVAVLHRYRFSLDRLRLLAAILRLDPIITTPDGCCGRAGVVHTSKAGLAAAAGYGRDRAAGLRARRHLGELAAAGLLELHGSRAGLHLTIAWDVLAGAQRLAAPATPEPAHRPDRNPSSRAARRLHAHLAARLAAHGYPVGESRPVHLRDLGSHIRKLGLDEFHRRQGQAKRPQPPAPNPPPPTDRRQQLADLGEANLQGAYGLLFTPRFAHLATAGLDLACHPSTIAILYAAWRTAALPLTELPHRPAAIIDPQGAPS
jgi:hypothetical protein